MAASASRCEYPELLANRFSDSSARAFWPLRTHHHGDSGARYVPMARGTGHIHCRAKGILYLQKRHQLCHKYYSPLR